MEGSLECLKYWNCLIIEPIESKYRLGETESVCVWGACKTTQDIFTLVFDKNENIHIKIKAGF